MSYYETEQAEHECPTPLERRIEDMGAGGLVFTPAGRWETITDREGGPLRVTVVTDRCTWTFWGSDKLPYVDGWKLDQPGAVIVDESSHYLEVKVGRERGSFSRGHVLASAQQIRGTGWQITDRPAGTHDLEYVTVDSKAKARAEMNRRARAHAKRLGLAVAK